VISPDRKVAYCNQNINPYKHVERVLKAFEALRK